MALGRELASPQQARVQKFGLANITTARRSARTILIGKRRACTSPEPTARARRRRCWNPSFAPPVSAPDSTLRRISSESTSASASTAKTSRTKISPRPGRACMRRSNRSLRAASSPRIRRTSNASRRWRSLPSPKAAWPSPCTKWAWAAGSIRPTSSCRKSRSSRPLISITRVFSATPLRKSREKRPESSSRAYRS